MDDQKNSKNSFAKNFKTNFKNNFKSTIRSRMVAASVLLLIICGILFFIEIGNAFKIIKSPLQLETIEQAKNLKSGDYVNLDITMIENYVISETKTYSKYGKEISSEESARYYMVPILDSKKNDIWYVIVKLQSENFGKAEKAMIAFENYIKTGQKPTEVILSVCGTIKDMSDEEKKYVPFGFDKIMDMIYIEKLNKTRTLIVTGVSFLLVVLSVGYIIYFIKYNKKEKARLEEEMKNNNQAPQNINVQ